MATDDGDDLWRSEEAKASAAETELEVKRLEAELDDLKKRWPAHSVKPQMVAELERLEEALEAAKRRLARYAEEAGDVHANHSR